jgi:integrase
VSSNPSGKRRRRKASLDRPPKPYPDFPLCAANNGYWQKKINGKVHYFTRWGRVVNGRIQRTQEDGGWQAALELYEKQRDALYAGRTPRIDDEGLTVGGLCNQFLTGKMRLVESGEIAPRTFAEYRGTTDRLVSTLGKDRLVDDLAADDFAAIRAEAAKQWGPVRLGNEIQRVRTVFKFGYEANLIRQPVRFGPEFKKPSRKVLRKHRATNGHRLFEAAEIRAMLDAATPPVKAMILLGINCGFGNADCSSLPQSAVDLSGGWIRFPRPKTGIDRRCPLWSETVEALKAAIAERPTPKDKTDTDLVFITKYGHRWVRTTGEKHAPIDSVLTEFGKLLRRPRCPHCGSLQADANPVKCTACKRKPAKGQTWGKLKRAGLGFYALRHTFRTIADATKDFPAIRLIMGHADQSIDDVYREKIDDTRLTAVTKDVHTWLFGHYPINPPS